MPARNVVIVGGGVAGLAAAAAAAGQGARTTLVESSGRVGVSKAMTPLMLSDMLEETELVLPEARSLQALGVKVLTGEGVVSVDHEAKKLRMGAESRGLEFDSLVLCTGSAPQPPALRGASKPNVFVMDGVPDYLELSLGLDRFESVSVSGPVPLALKLGEALGKGGKRVHVYCGRGGIARQFPEDIAEMVRAASRDVSLVEGEIDSILGVDKVEAVLSEGTVRACDAVVLAPHSFPAFPEVACARGQGGGILVDESMATDLEGIFAAGDCAELKFKSGSVPTTSHSSSRLGGEVAGTNAAGGQARASLSCAYEQTFFGMEFCSAGLGLAEAAAMGLDAAAETRVSREREGETIVSMVYDTATHQVYGLLVAGRRALALSSAASLIVALGLTTEQVLYSEFPFSPGLDDVSPIALTARKICGPKRA